eukprot:CAMPEP_0204352408 /NCGR_PEP_ID=MMETSP0469-20131031/31869_1 /ASSEMBLY_ACC=CAM_ASM_000384 /TAXON_ID=2969 /ORGANISM="Oxyrrhis marina" /LENGTH=38 /DNA_ID= /DNA_START= /DNA_END= /DNA_ORIENTATION=
MDRAASPETCWTQLCGACRQPATRPRPRSGLPAARCAA